MFDVSADAYGRFMGRFSEPLALEFLAFADVAGDAHVLDVGCGPGALTAVLSARLGPSSVTAVDPSPSFVEAVTARCPGVEVHRGAAEHLAFADASFDAALAQLVVHFMAKPAVGLREMARVTRRDGVVAACVWDHAGGCGPLASFWQAAHELDTDAPGEGRLPGTRRGHLTELLVASGMRDVREEGLTVTAAFTGFDDWWAPFLLGVGPAGAYVAGLDADRRSALEQRCAELMPDEPFEVHATAWAAAGRA